MKPGEQLTMSGDESVDVIAVTSGKGGVGKTSIAVNLAISLAQEGREVVLFDADLGLSNVDIALGLKPKYDISEVLSGNRSLEEILVQGPGGVRVVPASSGVSAMTELSALQRAGLIRAFSDLTVPVDTLIVDTAAGIDGSVLSFCSACEMVMVVVCDEPTSITDAYALMKVLHVECGVKRFQVLANMVDHESQGQQIYGKLHRVADQFLDVQLGYLGAIPRDGYLKRALQQQCAVVERYPASHASKALRTLARRVGSTTRTAPGSGGLGFFVERLAYAGNRVAEV